MESLADNHGHRDVQPTGEQLQALTAIGFLYFDNSHLLEKYDGLAHGVFLAIKPHAEIGIYPDGQIKCMGDLRRIFQAAEILRIR